MPDTSDWMPSTWGGKNAMFANVKVKIGGYQAVLGLSNPKVLEIENLCDQYTTIYAFVTQTQAYSQAVTEWRDFVLMNGPDGAAAPAPPTSGGYSGPANAVCNVLGEFRKERDLMTKLDGWTQAIGEDLMLVKTDAPAFNEADVQPTIKVDAGQSGYTFGIIVAGRAGSDAWQVQTRVVGGDWVNQGNFTGKSADITITPPENAVPVQIEVRVQLRLKNQNYGLLSQIATVTVVP